MTDYAALGALAGGVPGFIGGSLFGKKKKKKKGPDPVVELFASLYNQQAKSAGLAESQHKKAIGGLEKGYGAALANLGGGASAAKQSVLNNQTQTQGALQQQLASSGLANTTTNANLAAGVGAQGSQALGAIDQNLGQMMAQLQAQKAQQVYGANQGLGQFYQQQFNPLMDIAGLRMQNQWNSKARKGQGGSGAGLGALAGGVAGSFLGPLGGMAGSQIGSSLFGGGGGGGAGGGGGYGGGSFNPWDYMQYPQG